LRHDKATDKAQADEPQWPEDALQEDTWLSREEAAAVCHAIVMSLPVLSGAALVARACAPICRLSRMGDHLVARALGDGRIDGALSDSGLWLRRRPISEPALEYLKASLSDCAFGRLESRYALMEKLNWNEERDFLPVTALYDLIADGFRMDQRRRRAGRSAARRARERADSESAASAHRRLLGAVDRKDKNGGEHARRGE
jgi:hypothetical protein